MAELSFCRWRISHGSIDRFYRQTSGGRLMIFGLVLARCWRSILRSKLILLLAHLVLLFLTGYGDVPHVAAKAAAKAVLLNGEDQYEAVSEQSRAREDSLEKDRIIEDLQDHLGRAHEVTTRRM
ncbi:hypothetical protein Tsp_05546 [Trichinella spiralis]|uniref:hypothetical protein n=1 Tax=Trichinella spiralis TaxID=6334 RepID=UPI0001EFDDCA|nr:hypothetical protein Tsp_05546 [Trichinella spiralis]